MSEQSPYQQLGVSENATFEEIQDTRDRLREEYSSDRKRLETIEAAYDQILMERLRQRQEGKIKVPERIRFPERIVPEPPSFAPAPPKGVPAWLQRFLDTPSRADILWPAGVFLGLSSLSFFYPPYLSLALALGVIFSIYFLNRKEKKFGRSFVLTLITLIVGLAVGWPLGNWLVFQMGIGLTPDTLTTLFTFFILWLVSSFLR